MSGEEALTRVSHLSYCNYSFAAWMIDVMAACTTESFSYSKSITALSGGIKSHMAH